MIVTLTGPNIYALRRRLDELSQEFISEHGDLALERIDAADTPAQTILDSVQSLPFLAARKMIILREPGTNKETAELIEQIISSAGDNCDLIIYEPVPDKRTAYFRTLQKLTKLENFNELDSSGLARWLHEEATLAGAELTITDAAYLVDRVGTNQLLLGNELQKLLIYDKRISRQNIDLLTEATPQSKIFDLLDAAFGRNKRRALQLYEEQRAQKVEPQAILALITWQLQMMVVLQVAGGKSTPEIAADTGLKPYPLNKAANLVGKLPPGKLISMVDEMLDIDYRSKTSAIDLDEALRTYIVTL